MFKIKSLSMYGTNKDKSTVNFTDGLNIIYGSSNTGKSVIVECFDFIFGNKKAQMEINDEYDYVEMEISTGNGDISFSRKIKTGKIEVTSNNPSIESGVYSRAKDPKNPEKMFLDDIFLKLLGIEPRENIVVSQEWKKQDFTFRTCLHSFLIKQEDIIRRESVMLPLQNTSQPAFKSGLLYMITGRNFLNDSDRDSLSIRKARKNAVKTYVLDLLKDIDEKREKLKERASINPETLEKEIASTVERISETESVINQSLDKSRILSGQIYKLGEQIVECSNLLAKYEVLSTQYHADIKRMSLIVEGELNKTQTEKNSKCPFCNGEIDIEHEESCIEAAQKEILRITPQINDLEETKREIIIEQQAYISKRNELMNEKQKLVNLINNNLKPILEKLRTDLDKYKTAVEDAKEAKILLNMEQQYKEKIQDLDIKAIEEEKFKVMDLYTQEIIDGFTYEMIELLKTCNFDSFKEVVFNKGEFDFFIDGKPKHAQGQGYRTFLNTITAIALQNYIDKKAVYSPKLLIIDSPRQSLVENVAEEDLRSMKHGLFKYLVEHKNDRQTIIMENKIPGNIDYTGINIIHFTKDENTGRYGFIKDIK